MTPSKAATILTILMALAGCGIVQIGEPGEAQGDQVHGGGSVSEPCQALADSDVATAIGDGPYDHGQNMTSNSFCRWIASDGDANPALGGYSLDVEVLPVHPEDAYAHNMHRQYDPPIGYPSPCPEGTEDQAYGGGMETAVWCRVGDTDYRVAVRTGDPDAAPMGAQQTAAIGSLMVKVLGKYGA